MKLINAICALLLFIWISFFAPFVSMPYEYIFLLVMTVLFSIMLIFNFKFKELIFDKQDMPLWIFLFTMAGGLINITDRPVAYHHFLSFILPIPLIYYFAKLAFREEYGVLILRGICAASLLVCVLGVIEFITQENFIYRGIFNNIFYDVFKGVRMMSTQIHPAALGTYLAAVFPLALALAFKEKNPLLKLFSIFSAALILLCVILTFSRGALLGILMAVSTMLFFIFGRKKAFFILAAALLALVITVEVSTLLAYYSSRVFGRFGVQCLFDPSIYLRKINRFMSMWDILKDHPLFGLGFGHYRIFFSSYLPNLTGGTALLEKVSDCVYITLLTETGFIGFGGFVFFIFFLFKRIWIKAVSFSRREDGLLLLSFLSGFVGIFGAFLTYDVLYWTGPLCLFWAYAGILSSLSR